jgi:hypothetical protein
MTSLRSLVGPKLREIVQTRTRGKTPRKSFIVDMDASILRELGKHARALYNALRYMADGKSGELRFRERWYKAKEFDREAKMCERVRLAAMRELVTAGLVTYTRPRVSRMIGGRLRAVAGGVHYVVHREPVPLKNRRQTRDSSKLHLQNCIPGSLLEMQSQIVPNPPLGAGGSVFPDSENDSGSKSAKSSSAPGPADDDSRDSQSNFKGNGNGIPNHNPPVKEKQTHVEKILNRAAAILEERGDNPIFVAEALAFIDQRSHEARSIPASVRYYLIAYETLLNAPDDLAYVTDLVIRKKSLRAKFMPHPIIPNEKDTAKIAIVHQVVEEAARIGRPASEIMAERLVKRMKLAKPNGRAGPRQRSANEL